MVSDSKRSNVNGQKKALSLSRGDLSHRSVH